DPAIGIFESTAEAVPQRQALRDTRQVEAPTWRQLLAAAEMVIEQQPGTDKPGGSLRGRMRQHEAQRPDDVRGGCQQHLSLDQRLADQTEFIVFEIAQAAMDELARPR